MIVDTHTHVYLPAFDEDREEVMERSRQARVGMMMLPCVELASIEPMRRVHEQWPDMTMMAVGLHPTDVRPDDWEQQLAGLEAELDAHPSDYKAIGEIGIDLHWGDENLDLQKEAFRRQLQWAIGHDLPVIIHSREALAETLEVLKSLPKVPRLVFHSFTGTSEEVARIREVAPDAYFGLNGTATFKNCHVRDTVPAIGLDRLLLETDAPWLAPTPHRGKRCEPAHTALTLQHLADHLSIPADDLAADTTANARCFFKF